MARLVVFLAVCYPAGGAGHYARENKGLVTLFEATNGGQWINRTGWLDPTVSHCEWFGVTCDASSGAVTGLTLHHNRLAGTLPDALAIALQSLEFIFGGFNRLSGTLPSLPPALRVCEFGDNLMSGSIPNHIPVIGRIPKTDYSQLAVLSVRVNKLSGYYPPLLAPFLMTVAFDNNTGISGTLPQGYVNGTNGFVKYLSLSQCRMSGTMPSFGAVTSLYNLAIGSTLASGTIPDSFYALTTMCEVLFNEARLSGTLSAEMTQFTTAEQFTISGNQLSGVSLFLVCHYFRLRLQVCYLRISVS